MGENILLSKMREGGEKAVIGLEGYYPIDETRSDWEEEGRSVYVKVRIVGIRESQLRHSCGGPEFLAYPIQGIGRFVIQACKFYPDSQAVQEKELQDQREHERRELERSCREDRSIHQRRTAIDDAFRSLSPKQQGMVAEEVAAMALKTPPDPGSPDRWTHSHCTYLSRIILRVKYPSESDN